MLQIDIQITLRSLFSGNIFSDISDHLPNFLITTDINNTPDLKHRPKIRIFSNSNYKKFQNELEKIDWETQLYTLSDMNQAYTAFHNVIGGIFDYCFPLVRMSRRGVKDKEWITDGLKRCARTKNRLYRKWVKKKGQYDREKYVNYAKIFKKVLLEAETDYYNRVFASCANNSKLLWKQINNICSFNNKKSKYNTQISCLKYNNTQITDTLDICNHLNNYFCNVAGDLVSSLTPTNISHRQFMNAPILNSVFLEPVTKQELSILIDGLNLRKSPGYDNIGPKIIVDFSKYFITPLLFIFNKSISLGRVPDLLKISRVIPILKKSDKSNPTNYRPISMLSIFDKLLEKIIYKRIYNFLLKNNVLYKHQFGFQTGHSTTLSLIEIVDEIYKNLDDNNYAMGLFLDLQKAFDTVNHSILLDKISYYGIRGVAHDWFTSYLTHRKQFVGIGGISSNPKLVNHGVPQGSVLGPLLFLLYINDISNCVPNLKIKLFADDTNMFLFNKTIESLFLEANVSLDKINM